MPYEQTVFSKYTFVFQIVNKIYAIVTATCFKDTAILEDNWQLKHLTISEQFKNLILVLRIGNINDIRNHDNFRLFWFERFFVFSTFNYN